MAAEALAPLTSVLPQLSGDAVGAALRAAALHLVKRDDEIDVDGVIAALTQCGVTGSPKKLLGACGYLLKQAGKGGGQSEEKLRSSLGPLGFGEEHLAALVETLAWVKAGAVVADAPVAAPPVDDSPAEPPPRKAPAPAPAPVPLPEPAVEAPAAAGGGAADAETVRKFHWAAINGSASEVGQMLRGIAPALLDSQDNRGYSAYHHACANGHAAVVEALVHAGCNTQLANDFHLTGWRLARSLKKETVMRALDEVAGTAHKELAAEKVQIDREAEQQKAVRPPHPPTLRPAPRPPGALTVAAGLWLTAERRCRLARVLERQDRLRGRGAARRLHGVRRGGLGRVEAAGHLAPPVQ